MSLAGQARCLQRTFLSFRKHVGEDTDGDRALDSCPGRNFNKPNPRLSQHTDGLRQSPKKQLRVPHTGDGFPPWTGYSLLQ